MVSQIVLVRHGETEWSLHGRHTGTTDLPLTHNGEWRASQLRTGLQAMQFARVFTSPLLRARQTCDLAGYTSVAEEEACLREWDYGDFEGLTKLQIIEIQPSWNIFLDGCPHGESAAAVSQRADELLARLKVLDGMIALFSHAHFLRSLTVRWMGLPIADARHLALDTGSVSTLGYEPSDPDIPMLTLGNSRPDALEAS